MMMSDIGIIAMEVYFPDTCVDQIDLEKADNCIGKYTSGLGQLKMGVCSDLEDVNSIALTVTKRLLNKHVADPRKIGFLEVGTETIIDKSKSTKTILMELFEPYDNTDIQGVDCKNACFGGTAALFAALDWLQGDDCDGRLAIVVAVDIAVYEEKSARCTGGAGAVAMLLGPNAPLIFDKGVRSHYMSHKWDFYKPRLDSEYPICDGKLSLVCYQQAVDQCYKLYKQKCKKKGLIDDLMTTFRDKYKYCFHSPFTKLVEKSFARLVYSDVRDNPHLAKQFGLRVEKIESFLNGDFENSFGNRDFDKAILDMSSDLIEDKLRPGLMIAKNNGNMYTASLYAGIVSFLIQSPLDELVGSRLILFSYGSGLASCMFSLKVTENLDQLSKIVSSLSAISDTLKNRRVLQIEEFETFLERRENIVSKCDVRPTTELSFLNPDTYYLTSIDRKYRRQYDVYHPLSNGFFH